MPTADDVRVLRDMAAERDLLTMAGVTLLDCADALPRGSAWPTLMHDLGKMFIAQAVVVEEARLGAGEACDADRPRP